MGIPFCFVSIRFNAVFFSLHWYFHYTDFKIFMDLFCKRQLNQLRSQSSSLKVFAEVIFAILSCSNFWKLACFYQIKVQKVFSNKLLPIFRTWSHHHPFINYLSIINNIQGQNRLHNRRSNLPTAASGDAL